MTKTGDGWVEPRLTEEEAEKLDRLLSRLQEERNAQFELQGMSNDPVSYKSLIRNDLRRYLMERYL